MLSTIFNRLAMCRTMCGMRQVSSRQAASGPRQWTECIVGPE